MRLTDLPTPALVLDRPRLERNARRMAAVAARHGVRLRPHLKTAKSAEVARIAAFGQFGGLTVSTVAEAAWFAARGFCDLLYAVGIAPDKLEPLNRLQVEHGATLTLIADHPDQIRAAGERAAMLNARFSILIEVDTGGGRGGVDPDGPDLLDLARLIARAPALELQGVLAHAGHSYGASDHDEIRAIAEAERAGVVRSAERLRAAGFAAPVVSVGSTPTALLANGLEGVTEIRPGVYTLFDLDQAGRGMCAVDDIAVSVLATVIGHNPRAGRVLIDAGGLALSKDLSAAKFGPDTGFGLVTPVEPGAAPIPGHRVAEVHQEHGLISGPDGAGPDWDRFPVGSKVRVLPNHACMTAASYAEYLVVDGSVEVEERWDKVRGWF